MSTLSCSEKFTEDALLGGRVKLLQPRNGYRAAIDPVLLAAAIPAKTGQSAIELGLGSGAAALCLLIRVAGMKQITGLEFDFGQAELARRNASLNGMQDLLRVVEGDAAHPPSEIPRNHFDHAFMNPPFLEGGRHDAPPDPGKALAHIDTKDLLAAWISMAGKLLKPKGTLTLIHRADRLDQILGALAPAFGSLTILPIWPRANENAKRVIVQATKTGRAACKLLPGLVLHDANDYTVEAQSVLRDAAPLDLSR
ncbi:Methyltransferase small domain protein [Rhodospirillaceae bacterium LM-1]|nr:Methyltransferase small domain protein [Rhodospirillaceae bacterium LM-1]